MSAALPEVAADPPPPPLDARDQARLSALVHGNFEFVWRFLRRIGVPPAGCDDAAQQVFLVATRRLAEIAPGAERSFLVQTSLRVAADTRRRVARRREDAEASEGIAGIADPQPSPEDLTAKRRARAALEEILLGMDEDLRAVFVLFELESLAMREIAELLGVPPGTVASRLRRARELFDEAVRRLRARDDFRGRPR